eukprot:TRINITY_DN24697_c0_g1_i1.p2 TRINITY_DN24697_c0_g1~~TRINITY_DN24697_c0_g1_i1.p2  ORF type:complete len:102 (-),score=7.86 TRINITY_DN24697_c0_g1_i1:246-551(-)
MLLMDILGGAGICYALWTRWDRGHGRWQPVGGIMHEFAAWGVLWLAGSTHVFSFSQLGFVGRSMLVVQVAPRVFSDVTISTLVCIVAYCGGYFDSTLVLRW